MDDPFIASVTPADAAGGVRGQAARRLPAWQKHLSADDYVEYTWHAPTVRLLAARPRLRPP